MLQHTTSTGCRHGPITSPLLPRRGGAGGATRRLLRVRTTQPQPPAPATRAVTGQVREAPANGTDPSQRQEFDPNTLLEVAENPKKQFNWFKAWYPVAIVEDLTQELPSHAKLLGLDIALWWDRNAQQWRAFQDRCPHRLAPLSEGIIDAASGDLYCNYHGWTFNGAGACTGIPQLPEGQAISRSRSCVASYPTRVAEGLLWVWPDASPAAALESAAEEAWPGVAPEIDTLGDAAFSRTAAKHRWYARDMPYPWLAAKENAYNDCSHDQVLHHGVSRFADRTNAGPIPMRVATMTPVGYTVRETTGAFEDVTRFPCGARRQRAGFAGVAYVVPTGVGTCRQFHTILQTDPEAAAAAARQQGPLARLQGWLQGNRPTWAQHMFAHVLIDADIAIQARVDANRSVNDHVYMPAAADAGPAAFMRWLKEYGGGGPPVTKLKDPFVGHAPAVPQDRRQLLDRFNQHTKHCKACMTAYTHFAAAQMAAGVAAVVLASSALAAALLLLAAGGAASAPAVAPAAAVGPATWGVVAALAALAAAAAAAYAALRRLVDKFVFVDYDANHVGKRPAH